MSFKTSFQWFADFNTSTTGMQVVQFSAGGDIVRQRLAPMFAHYRKYKLGAIHVKFVPAATLPVDPTGLSYEAGENTVDPRDMFNPGLVRTTNGEDVYVPDDDVLNSEFADSLYYSTMLDKRWKKFRLQNGISLRAYPKFWGVANLRQNMFPGYFTNIPAISSASADTTIGGSTMNVRDLLTGTAGQSNAMVHEWNVGSSPMSLFQTGQKIPMGWMPTGASLKDEYGLLNGLSGTFTVGYKYNVVDANGGVQATFDTLDEAQTFLAEAQIYGTNEDWDYTTTAVTVDAADADAGVALAPVPEIPDLLTLVLPKSHKTQFYYRVYVKEDVYFADPITSINAISAPEDTGYFSPIDVFTRSQIGAWSPAEPVADRDTTQNIPYNDGQ